MTRKNILRRFVKLMNSSDLCFASSNHSLCYEEAIYHFFLTERSGILFQEIKHDRFLEVGIAAKARSAD